MLNIEGLKWRDGGRSDILKPGHSTNAPTLLYDKIEDDVIDLQVKKLAESKKMNESENKTIAPSKPEISFEDFSKMDIRTGTILEAEKVPKTEKLLKLLVDTGVDKRTVVSGIAEFYKPEDIVGKQVSILINLAPRKIKGIESQGMVLMAEDKDGKLSFVAPANVVNNGGKVA